MEMQLWCVRLSFFSSSSSVCVKTSRKSNFGWNWNSDESARFAARQRSNMQICEYENCDLCTLNARHTYSRRTMRTWKQPISMQANKSAQIDLTNYVWIDISFCQSVKQVCSFFVHTFLITSHTVQTLFNVKTYTHGQGSFVAASCCCCCMSWNKWSEFFSFEMI